MYYHVSTRQALPSILQRGLDNSLSTCELWSNSDDWDDGVYLWDSKQKAQAYADGFAGMDHEAVIIAVQAEGLVLSPDLTGAEVVEGAFYTECVPPQKLTVLCSSL